MFICLIFQIISIFNNSLVQVGSKCFFVVKDKQDKSPCLSLSSNGLSSINNGSKSHMLDLHGSLLNTNHRVPFLDLGGCRMYSKPPFSYSLDRFWIIGVKLLHSIIIKFEEVMVIFCLIWLKVWISTEDPFHPTALYQLAMGRKYLNMWRNLIPQVKVH